MGEVKLPTPRVRIIREGTPDLELQTTNADMVRWDLTRPKQRPAWPQMNEAPMLWMTFLGWAAARRTGAIEQGYTFERWMDDVLAVETLDTDPDANPETGSPFPEGFPGTPDL